MAPRAAFPPAAPSAAPMPAPPAPPTKAPFSRAVRPEQPVALRRATERSTTGAAICLCFAFITVPPLFIIIHSLIDVQSMSRDTALGSRGPPLSVWQEGAEELCQRAKFEWLLKP